MSQLILDHVLVKLMNLTQYSYHVLMNDNVDSRYTWLTVGQSHVGPMSPTSRILFSSVQFSLINDIMKYDRG